MSLTPVEVRHLELRRGLFGYRRSSVEKAIDDVADSFEAVWRERAELGERVHVLETEVARHVELETLLALDARLGGAGCAGHEGAGPSGGGRDRPGGERRRQAPGARRDRREGAAARRDAPHPGDAPGRARDRLRRCSPRADEAGRKRRARPGSSASPDSGAVRRLRASLSFGRAIDSATGRRVARSRQAPRAGVARRAPLGGRRAARRRLEAPCPLGARTGAGERRGHRASRAHARPRRPRRPDRVGPHVAGQGRRARRV